MAPVCIIYYIVGLLLLMQCVSSILVLKLVKVELILTILYTVG